MLLKLLFPVTLFALAVGLLVWHLRTWRETRRQESDQDERDYRWRQFRRRMQASGMLALIAVGLGIGQEIPIQTYPSLFVYFWFGIFLLLVWIVLLALADVVANRQRLTSIRRQQRIEQAKMMAELRRSE